MDLATMAVAMVLSPILGVCVLGTCGLIIGGAVEVIERLQSDATSRKS